MEKNLPPISAEDEIRFKVQDEMNFIYNIGYLEDKEDPDFCSNKDKNELLNHPPDDILLAYMSSPFSMGSALEKQGDPLSLNEVKSSSLSKEEIISEWNFDFKDMDLPSFDYEPQISSIPLDKFLQEESTNNATLRPNFESQPFKFVRSKSKRWGKREDITLFKVFRECEKQGLITLDSISQLTTTDEFKSHEGLQIIKNQLKCRQTVAFLGRRLVLKLTDKFSIRETKLLKRLLKAYQYKNVNYSEIIDKFSGKTFLGLKNYCDELCSLKRAKKLTTLNKLD